MPGGGAIIIFRAAARSGSTAVNLGSTAANFGISAFFGAATAGRGAGGRSLSSRRYRRHGSLPDKRRYRGAEEH